ncbi:MAG: MOSC domain-containing protein [Deltaproteobacteria bacterium]|nr:MOSC domain-containing protein [Deltaproteobacteria bacterium]
MRVVSVNVGLPRPVAYRGATVQTGIWKHPVAGRVAIVGDNLMGDRQADLRVHGGRDKAVYGYPSEHYPWWRARLPETELSWGAFGENLTVAELFEDRVRVGERFRVGTAELMVTQPRTPCFKLGIKLGRPQIVKEFLRSERSGFYFAVVRPGEIGAGDAIERVHAEPESMTITELVRLGVADAIDAATLRRAIALPGLAEVWRATFAKRLAD